MRPIERVRGIEDHFRRQRMTEAAMIGFMRDRGIAPVAGGSANFTQVSGPGGRTQSLTAAAAPQTFLWNPQALKGQLAGGDFVYCSRAKVRSLITMRAGTGPLNSPNTEVLAQAFGAVRIYSPFLGELVNKSLNSVPLLVNHDQYFSNGFKPFTRNRPAQAAETAASITMEHIFEMSFGRDYLLRSTDSMPWLPFLEGGVVEIDLAAATSLANWGWTVTNVVQTLTLDWYCDKQAIVHSPIASRLYRVNTMGPEFVLKAVGSPNGLDGVISGSRLAVLSWLAKGVAVGALAATPADNGFYTAFGGAGGINFGTAGINRLDVPFRDQVSVDDVSAWIESFLSDTGIIRPLPDTSDMSDGVNSNDLAGWPFVENGLATQQNTGEGPGTVGTSIICDALDFFPLIWPSDDDKISDFQKVNGDLSFTATLANPPPSSVLNLFRTDEVCGFTPDKVMDLMDRMGLPHVQRGGGYVFVPKYALPKKADATTTWGFPLKIILAPAA